MKRHEKGLTHLAEERHSVSIPCIRSLSEVVVRPLLERSQITHLKMVHKQEKSLRIHLGIKKLTW